MTWTVQKDSAPYAYVSVEGPVTAIEPYGNETDLKPMAVRYLGPEAGAQYAEDARPNHAKGNSIKVTVQPERWLTTDYGKR